MRSAIPEALLCMIVKWSGGKQGSSLKGDIAMSCRTQGDLCSSISSSIHQSVRLSPPGPLRPEISPFRPEICLLRPEICLLKPKICPLRPEICPLGPWICPIRPEICSLRPQTCPLRVRTESVDFRPERAWESLTGPGGMDLRTEERTNKSPPVFYRTLSPLGPLPYFLLFWFTTMQSRATGIADHIFLGN